MSCFQSRLFLSLFFCLSLNSTVLFSNNLKKVDLKKTTDIVIASKEKKASKFSSSYDKMRLSFEGKPTHELSASLYLSFLNKNISNDCSVSSSSTSDYKVDIECGDEDRPRLAVHDTLRLKYKWGGDADVQVSDSLTKIVDIESSVKGSSANKHLFWSKEAWLKLNLGNLKNGKDNYLQIGLLPYQVGRGISLGSAYKAGGFLGFTPGFSIDQYAPGVLFHVVPFSNKLSLELYGALLENKNISFKSNDEVIRKNAICVDSKRGIGRQSFALSAKLAGKLFENDGDFADAEFYALKFHAPDQKLEFLNDMDTDLVTFGFGLDGKSGKFDWGIEAAVNIGSALVKAWDRNSIELKRDVNGFLVEKYTKIYDKVLTDSSAVQVDVKDANKTVIDASSKDCSMNGKEISSAPSLFNSFDRFRPTQKMKVGGVMFVADCKYQAIEDELGLMIGTGYSSGDLYEQKDVNKMNSCQLMNQKGAGFISLQSVYAGKRIKHMVMFNKGIPKFSRKKPSAEFSNENITPISANERAEFANVAFVGFGAEWKARQLKDYKFNLSPNVISYWAADAPITSNSVTAKSYMGTEINTEVSAKVYDQLKLYSYFGVFVPGGYYTDMCGTVIDGQKTGDSVAFIMNVGLEFKF